MRSSHLPQIVVGVDVGGRKKGFHAVALRDTQFFEKLVTCHATTIVDWCRELKAAAVGIDAPCKWSSMGKPRSCERELARLGISAFATPKESVGCIHPFYDWMQNGAELFDALAPSYRLYEGPCSSDGVCFETFPQAIACALAGHKLSAKYKRSDRRLVLDQAGIAADLLGNIDFIDAGLCALAAHHFLDGTYTAYGDVEDGFIIVPAQAALICAISHLPQLPSDSSARRSAS